MKNKNKKAVTTVSLSPDVLAELRRVYEDDRIPPGQQLEKAWRMVHDEMRKNERPF